jgi:hypothetical protein
MYDPIDGHVQPPFGILLVRDLEGTCEYRPLSVAVLRLVRIQKEINFGQTMNDDAGEVGLGSPQSLKQFVAADVAWNLKLGLHKRTLY